MRLSKKGSMQLGVEAIVILIIAIVLLGSIIFFINTFITTDDLESIKDSKIGCGQTINPTDSSPILPRSMNIELNRRNSELEFCVKNDFGATIEDARVHIIQCLFPASTDAEVVVDQLTVRSIGEKIGRNEVKSFYFDLTTTDLAEDEYLGEWICQVQISKDPVPIDGDNPGIGPVQVRIAAE